MKYVNIGGRSHKVIQIVNSRLVSFDKDGKKTDVSVPFAEGNLHGVTFYTNLLTKDGELVGHPSEHWKDTGWVHTSQLSDEIIPEPECVRPCC